jgi:hypothetical protein
MDGYVSRPHAAQLGRVLAGQQFHGWPEECGPPGRGGLRAEVHLGKCLLPLEQRHGAWRFS